MSASSHNQKFEHRVFGNRNRGANDIYDNPAVLSALSKRKTKKTHENKSLIGDFINDIISGPITKDENGNVVVVLDTPGQYKVVAPKVASVCILSATGAGQGGGGASILSAQDNSPTTVKSGAGGAAGDCISNTIIEIANHNGDDVVADSSNWFLIISVGEGGTGGGRDEYYGHPGQPTTIEINSPCECCARTINVSGGFAGSSHLGFPGITVVGSQGTPDGGRGADSDVAVGGRGGRWMPKQASNSAGFPGGLGGGGGGGASPWGNCKKYTGGRGGHGFVRLEFV